MYVYSLWSNLDVLKTCLAADMPGRCLNTVRIFYGFVYKRGRVNCATVIDMPEKTEVRWVLRSRTVTVSRFIVSRYKPGTVAIREHFKKDRKAKRKATKLQKASEQ